MSTRTTEEMAEQIVNGVLARFDAMGYASWNDSASGAERMLLLHDVTTRTWQTTKGIDLLRTLVREELERP